jgi:hypothetical protein
MSSMNVNHCHVQTLHQSVNHCFVQPLCQSDTAYCEKCDPPAPAQHLTNLLVFENDANASPI